MATALAIAGLIGAFCSSSWKDVALVAMLFGMSLAFLFFG